jgi:16S rRNA (guanine527-N7)-methyltransferase
MSVSRETVPGVASRFDVPDATDALTALLAALAAEPDPPTTVREPAAALDIHVADSLSGLAVPELREATTIADIGAGAGFPGLALAVALPEARVDLIERLAAAAGLEGRARTIPVRAEEWAAGEGAAAYDAVTARAVASLAVLCEYAAPLLREGGVLVAWKGARQPEDEAAAAQAAQQLGLGSARVQPVTPFQGSKQHHLHVYSKLMPTPPKYPRRAGMAVKRPIG